MKPKAADQTWRRVFHNAAAEVYQSEEHHNYYKVVTNGKRPKYFYGDNAYMDYQRHVYDLTYRQA